MIKGWWLSLREMMAEDEDKRRAVHVLTIIGIVVLAGVGVLFLLFPKVMLIILIAVASIATLVLTVFGIVWSVETLRDN